MSAPRDTDGYDAVFTLIESLMDRMESRGTPPSRLATVLGVTPPTIRKWFAPDLTVVRAATIARALDARLRLTVEDDPARAGEAPIPETTALAKVSTEVSGIELSRRAGAEAALILGAKLRLAFAPNRRAATA